MENFFGKGLLLLTNVFVVPFDLSTSIERRQLPTTVIIVPEFPASNSECSYILNDQT